MGWSQGAQSCQRRAGHSGVCKTEDPSSVSPGWSPRFCRALAMFYHAHACLEKPYSFQRHHQEENLPFCCSQTSPGGALNPQATGGRMPDIHVCLQARREIALMQIPFGRALLCEESYDLDEPDSLLPKHETETWQNTTCSWVHKRYGNYLPKEVAGFHRKMSHHKNLPLCPATVSTDLTVSVEKPRIKCSMVPDCFLLQPAGTTEDPAQKRRAPPGSGGLQHPS
ncbi:uncharacterized protein RG961_006655 isoform 2-T8 [Leptosomus discolor]